jgi:hypothetical protein
VIATGILDGSSALSADPQIPLAPDSGSSQGLHDFREQLKDAQQDRDDVLTQPQPAGRSSDAKRSGGRGADKKDTESKQPPGSVPAGLVFPNINRLPLLLNLDAADGRADADSPGTAISGTQKDPADSGEPQPSQDTAPAPVEGAPAAQPVSEDLTFAVKARLNTTTNPTAEEEFSPAQESSPARITPAKEPPGADLEEDASGGSAAPPATSGAGEFAPAEPVLSSPPPGPQRAESPAPAQPLEQVAAAEQPQAPKPAAEPLKQLSIQLGQGQQERVDLRVVERGGEVQVAVRAANPDVAQGLRQGLTELVGRLEQNGYRAEAWRPGGTVTAVSEPGGARHASTEFQNHGSPQQRGSSPQQERQQGNPNQSNRPKWVEELESTSSGRVEPSTGEAYGIGR